MGWSEWWGNLLASASAAVLVEESVLPGMDYDDPDLALSGNQNAQNWRRLTQHSSDLNQMTQERMQQMALYLSDRNPLAKGIVDLLTAFIVGEGFTVTSKDDKVKEAIDRFWDDGQNDMAQRLEEFTRELAIFGEQMVLAFVNDVSGRVALVSVDPRTIRSVMPHPLATDRPYAVGLADDSNASTYRWVKIIAEDDDPSSDTYGKLIGSAPGETIRIGQNETHQFYQPPIADTGSRLAGCFFFPINKPRSAMRGRSDLLPVADFVDLYDRLMFDESERMSFLRTFVWWRKITGASAEDLKQKAMEPPPKPGSVLLTNESEEWTAMSPDLNSADSAITADMMLALVATGVGLPKLWLNGTADINRATAQESGGPALKRLTMRQKYVRRAVERIVRFVLDTAVTAGALADEGDAGIEFSVTVPEMSSKDLEKASRSLQTTVQALGMADAANWVDDETAQEAVVMMLGQLGLDVDLSEMRDRIEKQAAEDAENDQYELPEYLGMGKNPGRDALGAAMKDGGAGKEGQQPAGQPAA